MSLTIHYCQTCGARVEPDDIRAGRAFQYRQAWYCPDCRDEIESRTMLDPDELVQHSGETLDGEDPPERTLAALLQPPPGTRRKASPRKTTARKGAGRGAGSPRGAERPGGRKSTRRAAPRKTTTSARAARRGLPTPPAEPPSDGRARRPDQPPSWILPAMGATIVALLLVVAALLAGGGDAAPEGDTDGDAVVEQPQGTTTTTTATPPTPTPPPEPRPPDGKRGQATGEPEDGLGALYARLEELRRLDEAEPRKLITRIARYRLLAEAAAGTPVEGRALAAARELGRELDLRARAELDALTSTARELARAGDLDGAMARLDSFDEELRSQRWIEALKAARGELMRLARRQAPVVWSGRDLDGWHVTKRAQWTLRDGILGVSAPPGSTCRMLFRDATDWSRYRLSFRVRKIRRALIVYLHYQTRTDSTRYIIDATRHELGDDWVRVSVEVGPNTLSAASPDVASLSLRQRTKTTRGVFGFLITRDAGCELRDIEVVRQDE